MFETRIERISAVFGGRKFATNSGFLKQFFEKRQPVPAVRAASFAATEFAQQPAAEGQCNNSFYGEEQNAG
jgi:hypothetical protein